jgi:hypothetical protein
MTTNHRKAFFEDGTSWPQESSATRFAYEYISLAMTSSGKSQPSVSRERPRCRRIENTRTRAGIAERPEPSGTVPQHRMLEKRKQARACLGLNPDFLRQAHPSLAQAQEGAASAHGVSRNATDEEPGKSHVLRPHHLEPWYYETKKLRIRFKPVTLTFCMLGPSKYTKGEISEIILEPRFSGTPAFSSRCVVQPSGLTHNQLGIALPGLDQHVRRLTAFIGIQHRNREVARGGSNAGSGWLDCPSS